MFQNGESENALLKARTDTSLIYVAESDHQVHNAPIEQIRRIEYIDTYYDDLAFPISSAEIERTKTNQNTFGYAVGGAVFGGATGLIIALPLWYADVEGIPPYFVAGAGAVVGSIYFALKGQEKDRDVAVQKIRYSRQRERDLQEQIEKEKKQLEELEKSKKEIEEQLKKKKAPK
ncbi:MAG: hypothetical protein Kow0042_02100 [Calditrichia bacterium]